MLRKKKDDFEADLVKFCPLCNTKFPSDHEFCPRDGHKLYLETEYSDGNEVKKCVSCGRPLRPGTMMCPYCSAVQETTGLSGSQVRLDIDGFGVIFLDRFPSEIGRRELARHQNAAYVNPRHVRFTRENQRFYIEDLKTLNGTSVGDKILGGGSRERKVEVRDGTRITLGKNSSDASIEMVFKVLESGKWPNL
ncbi:MAG: FHA domain-containing protein [Candidatus Thermoplasmatota archaeon]|nr:FHA domain-containing protein [Candidatus Thermoplasmatota archaeon]MCL5438178.1 FHA domain-containing protein [Candidatus Thermoplasmatota archaeon]